MERRGGKMRYDVTGKKEREITAEVLRLAEVYDVVEVLREPSGRKTIVCRMLIPKRARAG